MISNQMLVSDEVLSEKLALAYAEYRFKENYLLH
jgi:hypothetical protein